MKRYIAGVLVIAMGLSWGDLAVAQQQTPQPVNPPSVSSNESSSAAVNQQVEEASAALPDAPSPVGQQQNGQNTQSTNPPSNDAQQQGTENKPVGTAAAPYEKTTGIPGSRPAGAVIAPGKQRRVKAIWISVGVIVAAGVAVGTVAALSNGSPARP